MADLDDEKPDNGIDEDVTFNIRKNLDLEFIDAAKETEVTPLETDHMKVYLRVRPFSDEEVHNNENQSCVKVESEHVCITNAPKDSNTFKNAQHRLGKGISQKFSFSKIFTEDTGQKQFFDEAVLGTVREFINGQNCLMFTYGVTNSGKTYTVQGIPKDVGILPRALDVIFNSIGDHQWTGPMLKPHMFCDVIRLRSNQEDEERKLKNSLLKLAESEENEIDMTSNMSRMTADSTMSEDSLMRQSLTSNASTHSNRNSAELGDLLVNDESVIEVESQGNMKFSVWVSFAEIYNENIHDLLEPIISKRRYTRGRPMLPLRDDKNGTPYARGLKEIQVTSADEAYKLLTIGKKNLQTACTKLNRNSSRSHCIFTIKILRVVDKANPNVARMSMLSFCDLAGSERYTKTHSLGDRIKEAGNINTSLLTLGRCIQVLRHNQTNKDHPQVVPFRDSKLTRLFQSFFCGKGRASMIVNVNQCASTFDETLHALKYSAIAKQIIVIQEPEKPKRRPQSERQFSVLLNQNSRQTIGWATPGTCAKVFAEEEEDEEDEDDDCEETASETEREKELVVLLEQMKAMLVNERRKQLSLEARIREEVCKEMSEQIVEIETHYCERLKREQALHEEKAERRMEILTQSVLKSRKRQRIFDDAENEEYVSSVLLHAEQAKVQKLDREMDDVRDQVEVLTAENSQLREAADVIIKERDKLQQENTSFKFQMSDLEIKQEKWDGSKVDQLINQSFPSEKGSLETKLSETEAELEKQKESVSELQQVIDLVRCNSADGEAKLLQVQEDLHKSTHQLTLVQDNLTTKEATIEDLEKQLEERKEKLECMQTVSSEQDQQLEELQLSLDQITGELEKLNKESEEQDKIMADLRLENTKRQVEYEVLQGTSTQRDEGLPALEEKGKLVEDLEAKNAMIASLEEEKVNLKEIISELKDSEEQRKENVNNLERQLTEAQELVLRHESKLESLKTSLKSKSDTDLELSRLRDEFDELTELNQTHKFELKEALDLQKEYEAMDESKENELQAVFAMQDKLKEQLKVSEETLNEFKSRKQEAAKKLTAELQTVVESKDKELAKNQLLQETVKTEMECLRKGLVETKHQLEEAGVEHEAEISELKNKLVELEAKSQAVHSSQTLNLKEEIQALKEKLTEKEKQINSMEELLNEANDTLKSKVEELGDCQPVIEASRDEVSRIKEELDVVRKHHKQSQKEMEDYMVKVNEQVEMIGELKEKLKAKTEEKASLEKDMELLRSEKLHNNAEIEKLQTELKIQQDLLDRENDKFEGRISEFELEVKNLREKLEQSSKQEDKFKEVAQELERKYSTMRVSMEIMNEETEAEREEHEDVLNKTRVEAQEKNSRLTELEVEIEHLKMQTNGQERDKTEAEAELAELKQTVSRLEQTLSDSESSHESLCRQLRREKGNVEKLLKNAEESKQEVEKQAQDLKSELQDLKAKQHINETSKMEIVAKHKARAEKMEGVVVDLEICLKSSKDHEAKSILEMENFKQRCRRLEDDCHNKEDTICSLTDEIERYREESVIAANLSNAENTAQMDALRREVMDLKQAADRLEFDLQDVKEEKILSDNDAQSKLTEAAAKIKELEAEISDLEDKVKGSDARNEAVSRQLVDLVKDLDILKEEAIRNDHDATEKLKDMQLQLANKVSEFEAIKEKCESMENTVANLTEDCEELRNQLKKSQGEITAEAAASVEHIQELEDQLKTKNDAISGDHQQQLQEVVIKLSAAENTISTLEQKLIELRTQSSSEAKELQSELIGKSNELMEYQNKLERRETIIEEFRGNKVDLEMKLELLTNKLNNKDGQTSEDVHNLESKLKTTCEDLVNSRDQINDHVKICADLEDKCAELKEKVQELKENNEKLESDVASKDEVLSQIDNLQQRVKELENECQDVKSDSRVDNEQLKSLLEDEKRSVIELKDTVSELKAKIQQQTPKVEECELLQSQIIVLEKTLNSLEVAVGDGEVTKTRLAELESELEKEHKSKDKLQGMVETLQEEIDELEKSLSHKKKLFAESNNLRDEVSKLRDEIAQNQSSARKERGAFEETIDRLERDVREKKIVSQEYKNELDSLKKSMDETEKKLQEAVTRTRKIEDELATCKTDLERKESRLKSRTEALSNFMNKMDQEKNSYDIILNDAKSNEMVIEQLRLTLREQESTMQAQEKVLQNQEDEIKLLGDEIQQHIDRCSQCQKRERESKEDLKRLREENNSIQRKLKQYEAEQDSLIRQVKELQQIREIGSSQHEEIQMLQRAKDRAEEKLTKARAKQEEAEKQLRDKIRHEEDLRDTNKELQQLEKKLKEKDEELSAIRKNYELLKSQESVQNITHQQSLEASASDTHSLKILKTKFRDKEEQVQQLEQEKQQWKSKAETIEERKAQELEKWRSERDKLVVQIEKILMEKESQSGTDDTDSMRRTIQDLQKHIKDKDAIIKEISSHLDKSSGQTRRRRKKTASSSTEEDPENIRKEMAVLHMQVEQERHEHRDEVNKIIKAKDFIIQDMRQQNHQLTSHIAAGSKEFETVDLTADTPTTVKAKGKRGRARKRKSSEHETNEDEQTPAPTRITRGRKSSRSSRHENKSMDLDENDDPSLGMICEEGVIDLDDTAQRKSTLTVLSVAESDNREYDSPQKSAAPPMPQSRRKKRLKSMNEQPLMESPVEQDVAAKPTVSVHDMVKRKLRSRRK